MGPSLTVGEVEREMACGSLQHRPVRTESARGVGQGGVLKAGEGGWAVGLTLQLASEQGFA